MLFISRKPVLIFAVLPYRNLHLSQNGPRICPQRCFGELRYRSGGCAMRRRSGWVKQGGAYADPTRTTSSTLNVVESVRCSSALRPRSSLRCSPSCRSTVSQQSDDGTGQLGYAEDGDRAEQARLWAEGTSRSGDTSGKRRRGMMDQGGGREGRLTLA